MKAMVEEVKIWGEALRHREVDTIFFGGGTPSLLEDALLHQLIDAIEDNFSLSSLREWTMEGNPESLVKQDLLQLRKRGIDRISMGVQSFSEKTLALLGRIHGLQEVEEALQKIHKAGFPKQNLDLMIALPGQGLEDVLEDTRKAISSDINHVSVYSLILEEKTALARSLSHGKFPPLPREEEERAMFHESEKLLEEAGFFHYEISNFAKKGKECLHNLRTWDLGEYLGLGPGAASNGKWGRWQNLPDISSYRKALGRGELPEASMEELTALDRKNEFFALGLRRAHGVSFQEYKWRFDEDMEEEYGETIDELLRDGLLLVNADSLFLTPKGRDLANVVELAFFRLSS